MNFRIEYKPPLTKEEEEEASKYKTYVFTYLPPEHEQQQMVREMLASYIAENDRIMLQFNQDNERLRT